MYMHVISVIVSRVYTRVPKFDPCSGIRPEIQLVFISPVPKRPRPGIGFQVLFVLWFTLGMLIQFRSPPSSAHQDDHDQ